MKIKILSVILIIAIAGAGCLKDTQQAVSHINDVNLSITGVWTQIKSTTAYYDADNKQVYTSALYYNKAPYTMLQFDGDKLFTRTDTTGIKTTGNYTISTQNNIDYLNFTGDANGPHQYQLTALQSRALTLTETLAFTAGAIVIGSSGNNITYYKMVQVNAYVK